MMAARSRVRFQSRICVKPGMQKPGQKQHQHRLGNLRRLKGKVAAKANPAMGIVRTGNEENQHQQQSGDAQARDR